MIGKALTIAEKGGLQVHATERGADWSLWLKSWDKPISDTELGRLISNNGKAFDYRTIKAWREYYKQELADAV